MKDRDDSLVMPDEYNLHLEESCISEVTLIKKVCWQSFI